MSVQLTKVTYLIALNQDAIKKAQPELYGLPCPAPQPVFRLFFFHSVKNYSYST